jgi:hypothetical protein
VAGSVGGAWTYRQGRPFNWVRSLVITTPIAREGPSLAPCRPLIRVWSESAFRSGVVSDCRRTTCLRWTFSARFIAFGAASRKLDNARVVRRFQIPADEDGDWPGLDSGDRRSERRESSRRSQPELLIVSRRILHCLAKYSRYNWFSSGPRQDKYRKLSHCAPYLLYSVTAPDVRAHPTPPVRRALATPAILQLQILTLSCTSARMSAGRRRVIGRQ